MVLHDNVRPEASTTRAYEWNAHNYHEHSHPQFELAMDLMDTLNFKGDEVILDAGCGTGLLCEQLLHRVPQGRVIGVDVSDNMVQLARDFLSPIYDDRISIRRADLQVFCEPELANLIFSTSALHFVADHRLLYQNFAKILRPGGALALRFGTRECRDRPPLSLVYALEDDPRLSPYLAGWMPAFHGGDAIATRYYLQEAGFVDISVSTTDFTLDFSDLQTEPLSQLAFDEFSQRFPESLHAYLAERLKGVFDQAWRFDMELITVHATMPDLM